MHADRSRAGKQGKVPNLPEKIDSTSPSESGEAGRVAFGARPRDVLVFNTFLQNENTTR